jgi:mono/diheme cytochrome c family protein
MRDRSRLLTVALTCGLVWAADAPGDEPSRDPRPLWGRPTGEGLPPGRGTVRRGAQVYAGACAQCHGPSGGESPGPLLVGGR